MKVVKTNAYYKRFQVQFRRRRENKTDYYARKRLIIQDKNKYATPKYRFVVRVTNKDVVCQIFAADLTHDRCVASAYAHELARYGIKLGLTNYAACYATGLLLARRVNSKFKLAFEGVAEANGEEYLVDPDVDAGPKPFCAYLDVGLARTTTGARIFGALKGAVDGGLYIPHNVKRFPGSSYNSESKEWEYDAELHKKYIYGGHVADYMKTMQEEDPEKYKKQFSRFVAAKIGHADLAKLYKTAHAAIRKDPNIKRAAGERGAFNKPTKDGKPADKKKVDHRPRHKLSVQQRMGRVHEKIRLINSKKAVVAAAKK